MLEFIRKNPPVSKCSSERGIHDDIIKEINRRPDFKYLSQAKTAKNYLCAKISHFKTKNTV